MFNQGGFYAPFSLLFLDVLYFLEFIFEFQAHISSHILTKDFYIYNLHIEDHGTSYQNYLFCSLEIPTLLHLQNAWYFQSDQDVIQKAPVVPKLPFSVTGKAMMHLKPSIPLRCQTEDNIVCWASLYTKCFAMVHSFCRLASHFLDYWNEAAPFSIENSKDQ